MNTALKQVLTTWMLPVAVCLSIAIGWTIPRWGHYQTLSQVTQSLHLQHSCVLATPQNLPSAKVRRTIAQYLGQQSISLSNQYFLAPRWQQFDGTAPTWQLQATQGLPTLTHIANGALHLSPIVPINRIQLQQHVGTGKPNGTTNDAAPLYRLNLSTARR